MKTAAGGPSRRVSEDTTVEETLRPTNWRDYVGQEAVKNGLRIIIDASRKRKESADHLLFSGQAGLGKTTLAHLVARELGASLRITSGPALEKAGDLAAILTNLAPGEILFVDEAHRISPIIEEILYPAMESRKLHLVLGKGPSARTLSLDLPPFTLVAATTRENLLSQPLRSRFGATFRLGYYGFADIEKILLRSARILGAAIDGEAIGVLARAARGTPRVANRLLKRARDYTEVRGKSILDGQAARETLAVLEMDELGLEPQDRRLLKIIVEKFGGGPVGLNTLAAALNDDRGAIEEIYEPYLMSLGFLKRSPMGRVVLPAAYAHLGIKQKGELL